MNNLQPFRISTGIDLPLFERPSPLRCSLPKKRDLDCQVRTMEELVVVANEVQI